MMSKIDHLGILVEDIDENRKLFELPVGSAEYVPAFGVDIAFIRVGESLVELVEPVDRDSALAGDLEESEQPTVLHHIARVDDIEATLATLRDAGCHSPMRPLLRGLVMPLSPFSNSGQQTVFPSNWSNERRT